MSIQQGNLVSHILSDHFGEIVANVGNTLFRYGSQPIALIMKASTLPRNQIVQSLRALIKYGLVTFEPSTNEVVADYKIIKENVLCLMRYPKYVLLIKNKFGYEAELIVEEMLREGSITVTDLIVNIVTKTKDDKDKNVTVISVRDTLISLVTAGYIQRSPVPTLETIEADVPILETNDASKQLLPEVDIHIVAKLIDGEESVDVKDDVHWKCNLDRFHQDLRDELMITAMTRCIDESGGELMRQLLQQMYIRTDPWASASNPIPLVDLRDYCKRVSTEFPLLHQYLEQYLKVMEESWSGVVCCTGDAGGGQYTLRTSKAMELLVWDVLCATVQERLGTKAARIFRLIKEKKYIEEEDIQRNAMLPAKEAKQYTYQLLEEHFIDVQVLRKNASSNSGPSKAFYVYRIDLHQVANMFLEVIYKALYNAMTRREYERFTNTRLIEKQQRVDTIVHGMRLRGEPQENIQDIEETVTPPEKMVLENIKHTINKLSTAEIQLDETLFILQTHFAYKNK